MDLSVPPPDIQNLLESNPLKSKLLIRGLAVRYGDMITSPVETMPGLKTAIKVVDITIGTIFFFEIVIKAVAYKMDFFRVPLHYLDPVDCDSESNPDPKLEAALAAFSPTEGLPSSGAMHSSLRSELNLVGSHKFNLQTFK